MNTNLKVILTAIGIATLASPVMAQSGSYRHVAPNAYGAAVNAQTAPVNEGNPFHINDAVHVAFPQLSGGN
jgi:hypothetical protein